VQDGSEIAIAGDLVGKLAKLRSQRLRRGRIVGGAQAREDQRAKAVDLDGKQREYSATEVLRSAVRARITVADAQAGGSSCLAG